MFKMRCENARHHDSEGSNMQSLKRQVGGDHYKNLVIQPVRYIQANKLGFCEGSIIKYATRWGEKGGIKDLVKFKHFCDILIEDEKAEQEIIDNRTRS